MLRALWHKLLAVAVLSIRFMAVASPPTSTVGPSPAGGRDDDADGIAGIAPHRGPGRGSSRGLIDGRAGPRVPGAHPVTRAAHRRPASVSAATQPRNAVVHPLRRAAPAFVLWLTPIAHLIAGPSRPAAGRPIATATRSTSGWAVKQRVVSGAVAVLVLVASVIGVSPVRSPIGGTGNVLGAGIGPRIAIGGGTSTSAGVTATGADRGFGSLSGAADPSPGVPEFLGLSTSITPPADRSDDGSVFAGDPLADGVSGTDPIVASQDVEGAAATRLTVPDGITPSPAAAAALATDSTGLGAFLADGTILKPIAVDTTIPDARTLLTTYKVRKGDTLTSIAHHFGLSLVTVYWANHLTTNLQTKTDLKVGQSLSIPPVNGVLHIVTDKETLSDISKRTNVSVAKIVSANGLKQPTVFVGQWIIVPGAKAKPIPEPAPKPVVKPVARPTTPVSKPVAKPAPRPVIRPTYSGGGWKWPVPGGFISQYFHYGHWGVDIAATYGDPVLAAKPGVVTFAGWKNNGGGWQVWISHGNGVYTTYNHMSSLTVGSGQSVGGGQQVGRIGMTGHATGPHLHFEVWIGPIWNGGTRVNPLNYV